MEQEFLWVPLKDANDTAESFPYDTDFLGSSGLQIAQGLPNASIEVIEPGYSCIKITDPNAADFDASFSNSVSGSYETAGIVGPTAPPIRW